MGIGAGKCVEMWESVGLWGECGVGVWWRVKGDLEFVELGVWAGR